MSAMLSDRPWPKLFGFACASVLIIEVVYWIAVAALVEKPDSAGTFGDMFGALNTFFAGLAFLGVVFTIYTQVTQASDARREQTESLRLIQAEVAILREDIELQRRRDKVEAGPFFELTSCSQSGQSLDFKVKNVGAAVIVKDFAILTLGCSLRSWYPSTLPPGTEFSAPCHVPAPRAEFRFQMGLRDRWGEHRMYELRLMIDPVGRLDFKEVATNPLYNIDDRVLP